MANRLIKLPQEGKAIVASDFHGNWADFETAENRFLQLKNENGATSATGATYFIIAGDILDRGSDSERILDEVRTLKKTYPDNVHFLMGNHEWGYVELQRTGEVSHSPCDFYYAMQKKYGKVPEEFVGFLNDLPLAAITANGIAIMHGGPCSTLPNISRLDYANNLADNKLINSTVWADPSSKKSGYSPNAERTRGDVMLAGALGLETYGDAALNEFLNNSGAQWLITGHGHRTDLDVLPRQMMISSSFKRAGPKAWVELELGKYYSTKESLKDAVKSRY